MNAINGISINGISLIPDEQTKIVNMPVFAGVDAGLVPVVPHSLTNTETSFLSANGDWVDVSALIDEKLENAVVWEEIA